MNNKYFCLIGRDSHDNEQRELSPGTSRLLSEKLHTLNYTSFLLKVRDSFLGIERGENYYEHKVSPRSFFYCPLIVSDGKPDAAAVWGECGFYGGGREFRYAHFYLDDYREITPRELVSRVFTSEFLDGDAITALFDRNRKEIPEPAADCCAYDSDYSPEIRDADRMLVCEAAEKLCDGKTVVIKLGKTGDFNCAAHDLLGQIISLLPGEFRKQIGFATYLQPRQIRSFASQSNNLRLIIVDSDVDFSEIGELPNFCLMTQSGEHTSGELYEFWSRLSFSERELQAERFVVTRRRIPGAKLLAELSGLYKKDGLLPEPAEKPETEPVKETLNEIEEAKNVSADTAEIKTVSDQKKADSEIPEGFGERIGWFLRQNEVKMIAAAASLIALFIGFAVGKII